MSAPLLNRDERDRLAKIAKNADPAADFPGGVHVRRAGRFLTIRTSTARSE